MRFNQISPTRSVANSPTTTVTDDVEAVGRELMISLSKLADRLDEFLDMIDADIAAQAPRRNPRGKGRA
jgi:hypothetical protein